MMPEWIEVLKVLVDGPRLPVHGVIRTQQGQPVGPDTFGFVGEIPMIVSADGNDVRVWRHGSRLRVETLDGSLYYLTDGRTAWQFAAKKRYPPTYADISKVRYLGPASELLVSREARDWLHGDDFTQPTGPVVDYKFLGRACWSIELAPPPHKPAPLQLVVDIESGAVVQQRSDAFGVAIGYSEIIVGEPAADDIFRWTGDAVSLHELRTNERARQATKEAARQAKLRDWFAANVADPSLTIPIQADLSVRQLREVNTKNGSFYAEVGAEWGRGISGSLMRRPRSKNRWNQGASAVIHRWSTIEFDWAAWLHEGQLDPEALARLQHHLHPNETATNEFTEDHTDRDHTE